MEPFSRDAPDRILFGLFRGDVPNLAAAWRILRQWPLGDKIFRLLLEHARLAQASEECATWTFADGSKMTVYPDRFVN